MKTEIVVPAVLGGLVGLVVGLIGRDVFAAVVVGVAVSALVSFVFASAPKDFNGPRIDLSGMPFALAISGSASSFAAELSFGWSIGAAVFGYIVGVTVLGVAFFKAEEQIEAAITSQELRKIDKNELQADAPADEVPPAKANTGSTKYQFQTPPKKATYNPKDNVRMTPRQLPSDLVQILVTLSEQEQARIDALPFAEQVAALEKIRDTQTRNQFQIPPNNSAPNPNDNVRMTPRQLPIRLVEILVTLSDQEQKRIKALPFAEQATALEKVRDTPQSNPVRSITCGHCKTEFSLPTGENGYCPKCNWLFVNRY